MDFLVRRTGAALQSSVRRALPALALGGLVVALVLFA